MQKYILFLMVLFLLFSCWWNNNKVTNQKIHNDIVSQNKMWTWTIEDQDTSSWVILENVEITTLQEKKYCMLDECIPDDIEVKEEKWFYLWNIDKKGEYEEDTKEYTYKLSKNLDYFQITLHQYMYEETTEIFKIWENYIKSIDGAWCGWSNIKQKVYNKDWKEIEDYFLEDIKKNIFIWNIMYTQTLTWTWWFWQPLDSFNNFKVYFDDKIRWYKIFEDEKEFVDYVTNDYKKEEKRIFKNYIVQFKKYPWINIMYNSEYDWKSIRVVYLWNDANYLSKNIDRDWNFIDLSITNKIIGYFNWENVNNAIFDTSWNRITKVDLSKLPIFKMKKLNNEWNYLVYLNDWYELQSLAEMCKPVVYYYSKDKESNSLTLNTKKWDYFTKLIPDFTSKNTWNFNANNSKIEVSEKKYDYLYYSLVTIWYEHNNDWWIVKWEDIITFFEDKLVKINFNEQEQKDFIDFWKTEYEKGKYYFISFKYKQELDKIIKLNFSKRVENEFRVLLDSYEIDYIENKHKKYLYDKNDKEKFDRFLIQRFNRNYSKNEVFEWGGVLRKPDEIITR